MQPCNQWMLNDKSNRETNYPVDKSKDINWCIHYPEGTNVVIKVLNYFVLFQINLREIERPIWSAHI